MSSLATKNLLITLGVLCCVTSLTALRVMDEKIDEKKARFGGRRGGFETNERKLLHHHWAFFIRGTPVSRPRPPSGGFSISAGFLTKASASAALEFPLLSPAVEGGFLLGIYIPDTESFLIAQALVNAGVEHEVTPDGIFFGEIPPGTVIGPLPDGTSLEQFEIDEESNAVGSMSSEEPTTNGTTQ